MPKDKDGGYYAIKGFLFQYDKTIIEIFNNQNSDVSIEQVQDVNYENYVLQIKHKEKQTFSNSKIKKAIIELLDIYSSNTSLKFCLYAFFIDKKPEKKIFKTIDELKNVLIYRNAEKNKQLLKKYNDNLLNGFIANFELIFSENYPGQFKQAISLIQNTWKCSDEEAYIYHSLIRDHLMNVVTNHPKNKRVVKYDQIKKYIDSCKNITFSDTYREILGKDKYIKAIKSKFFTFRTTNINNFDRLFVIECDEPENRSKIRKVVDLVNKKFYKKDKSPAPYIVFRNLKNDLLTQVKRDMIDDKIHFTDGTCFDGDKFRLDETQNKDLIKIINENHLNELINFINYKEIYNIYRTDKIPIHSEAIINSFMLENLDEVIKVLE